MAEIPRFRFVPVNLRLLMLVPVSLAAIPAGATVPVGMFEQSQDIGGPAIEGNAHYDEAEQAYTLSGAGKNMWFGRDEFHFAWKQVEGDFILRATIRFVGEGVDPHRKIGVMVRESLEADSAYADACVHGDGLTSLQYRTETGADTEEVGMEIGALPTEIQMERRGDVFIFSAATPGAEYRSVRKEMGLPAEVYTGLFICSHREDVMEQAVFSNVRLVKPAPADLVPYRDYLGSNLEVMEVVTGKRKILHSENRSLQAPNWTPDNKFLIYNADGLLYRYALQDGSITVLNTGFADHNNNDHVLSFDGEQLGISHHVGDECTSVIYTLPVAGSDKPRQITDPAKGHSFLHGWSPDAGKLIFTGQRDGQFDIWSVDLESGKETQLTDLPTLDDGSEYSPDGKWIYFNSVRTGTMQLWRMRPDGSEPEQLTFDDRNNWFPHLSPDGKWLVYISFPEDIDPSDHPFYKQVYLKLMPAEGGASRVIAYLYGGQGTINVPSWSPDGSKIAFVSNTGM